MKTKKTIVKFTDNECVLLSSLARTHFKMSEMKKETLKQVPIERQEKIIKFMEQLDFAYNIFLTNANDMFASHKDPRAMGFGFVLMSINELGALDGEEEKGAIMDKISDFLESVPEWVHLLTVTRANKSNPN